MKSFATEHIVWFQILAAILFISLVTSCTPNFDQEFTVISSLEDSLAVGTEIYSRLDSTKLSKAYDRYQKNMRDLHTLCETVNDTLSVQVGRKFNLYKGVQTGGEFFFENYSVGRRELIYSKSNVANLKKDITEFIYSKPVAERYVELEQNHIAQLLKAIRLMELAQKTVFEMDQLAGAEIEDLIAAKVSANSKH